jgi:flagellar hook assembly protein FlgD
VDKGGVEEAGARVRTLRLAGQQGAQRFVWDGKDEAGLAAAGERYIARLRWVDEAGVERQQESLTFVHASAEEQERKYAQIQGALALPNEAAAANVELELVNDAGVVVQRTRSTAGGNYLFRNLKDDQQYKVRVKKEGFVAAESAPIAPAPAAKARADMKLMAE